MFCMSLNDAENRKAFKADEAAYLERFPLTPEQKEGVEDPIEMERLADANLDKAHTRFVVSDDPEEVADRIGFYVDLGFEELVIHGPGADQGGFIDQFSTDVLPVLRERWGPGIADAAASGGG